MFFVRCSMNSTLALLSLLLLASFNSLDAAISWSHFQTNVDCNPALYDETTWTTALTSTWAGVKTDDTLAVYMLRTTGTPRDYEKSVIEGDFEIELKEFVPPDLFFFFADKASAADLRSQKADYGVDAVEAVPGNVKLVKELQNKMAAATASGDTQPEVSIELSPGSKANDKQADDLAKFWEGAVHGAQAGSVAKFNAKSKDLITLSGVKGSEMEGALGIVSSQPEALALELLPNFTEIDPVAPGTPQPISRRLQGLPRFLNNEADAIVQSGTGQTPLTTAGLQGQGEIVGIADSGLYDQSCFFNNNDQLQRNAEANTALRKVIEYVAFADGVAGEPNDHGTHVAGSVAGSSTVEGGKIYNGIAPDAKIHFFDIGLAGRPSLSVPGNLATGLFPDAKAAGAAIHTNSWGANINRYTTSSRDVDRYSYDNEDFVILIAAGNSGPTANTVGSPATAKNSISVGASVNPTNLQSGTIEDMATFSSRGPSADGRIKPDVVAPGHAILSAASEQACAIVQMSGTSMATPVTAGSVALVRQYFREGWYPSGVKTEANGFIPSGALLKAMVIHSGRKMTGQGVTQAFPDMSQGFGRVDLDSVLKLSATTSPERGTLWVRTTKVGTEAKSELAQGATFSKEFTMTGAGNIKATLVWMDPPSAINANTNLVNDLDLTVVCATVTSPYPNGGTAKDSLNNVEMIEIAVTQGTQCSVSVAATTIRQGATQPYALVVTGPFTATSEPDPTTSTAPPVTGTTAVTTTTAPAPALEYVKINAATCGNTCTCESLGMAPILDRTTCHLASEALGLSDPKASYVRGTPRPEGCYFTNNRLYLAYNIANKGNGVQGNREPLCKPAGKYYEILADGKCEDKEMVPISDVETCEAAALDLGLADSTAHSTASRNRPQGCYYRDRIPGFSLFFSTSDTNIGNGASRKRNQICKVPNPTLQSASTGDASGQQQGMAAGAASTRSSLLPVALVVMIGMLILY